MPRGRLGCRASHGRVRIAPDLERGCLDVRHRGARGSASARTCAIPIEHATQPARPVPDTCNGSAASRGATARAVHPRDRPRRHRTRALSVRLARCERCRRPCPLRSRAVCGRRNGAGVPALLAEDSRQRSRMTLVDDSNKNADVRSASYGSARSAIDNSVHADRCHAPARSQIEPTKPSIRSQHDSAAQRHATHVPSTNDRRPRDHRTRSRDAHDA